MKYILKVFWVRHVIIICFYLFFPTVRWRGHGQRERTSLQLQQTTDDLHRHASVTTQLHTHTHSYTGSESGVLGDNFQGIVCKPIKSSAAGLDHFRIKSCISVVWDDAIKSSLLGLSLHPVYCITFNLFSAEILENWTRVCLLLIILALAFLRKNKRGMWKKNGRTEGWQDNPFP